MPANELYRGKSKIICAAPEENALIMRFANDITAFNGEKAANLPGKGALCAAVSNLVYEFLAQNGIKTHLLKILDETSVLVKKAEIFGVEAIVRNAAAGGFVKKYGVARGTVFPHAVFEFSLKSDELGDPLINESHITALQIATREELDEITRLSLHINTLLCRLFSAAGIRLVDFKLEFGRNGGEIILCDEISPDSCRLWDIESGEMLDKDIFRDGDGDIIAAYSEVLRRLQSAA